MLTSPYCLGVVVHYLLVSVRAYHMSAGIRSSYEDSRNVVFTTYKLVGNSASQLICKARHSIRVAGMSLLVLMVGLAIRAKLLRVRAMDFISYRTSTVKVTVPSVAFRYIPR